jgi:predicted HTH transcriptional regulator
MLEIIAATPTISAARLSEITKANIRTIERNLVKLKDYGVIIREGSPYSGRWLVKKK